jgi:hypothetical protein
MREHSACATRNSRAIGFVFLVVLAGSASCIEPVPRIPTPRGDGSVDAATGADAPAGSDAPAIGGLDGGAEPIARDTAPPPVDVAAPLDQPANDMVIQTALDGAAPADTALPRDLAPAADGPTGDGPAFSFDLPSFRPDSAPPADTAPAAPTFTELFMQIFNVTMAQSPSSCAGANCHKPGTSGMVNFASKAMAYQSLMPKVVKGNPNASRLYMLISSGGMPRNRPKLSAALIEKVRLWIMGGALNN